MTSHSKRPSRHVRNKSRAPGNDLANLGDLSHLTAGLVTNEMARDLENVTRNLEPDEVWTGKMVGDRIIDAVKLCSRLGGRAAPAGAGAAWPEVFRDADEIKSGEPLRTAASTRVDATRMEAAITWQATYLSGPRHEGTLRVLSLWVRCKVGRKTNFNEAVKRRRWSRATAYRARDRALLLIAIGLMKDGVKP